MKELRLISIAEQVATHLREEILPFEANDAKVHFIVGLQHRFKEAGHTCSMTAKSLTDLRMDRKRAARLAENTNPDA